MQMCREPAVRKYGIVSIKSDLQALMSAYDTLSSVPLSFLKRGSVCASQLPSASLGLGKLVEVCIFIVDVFHPQAPGLLPEVGIPRTRV